MKSKLKPNLPLFSLDKTVNCYVPDKNNYFSLSTSLPLINIENAQINKRPSNMVPFTDFHGFINTDNVSCYANSLLQCLFNLECINSAIMLSPNSELKKLCLDFSSLASNTALNCYQLLSQFHSPQFNIKQQQDSTEIFPLLLAKYNFLQCLTSFNTENSYKCQNCNYVKHRFKTYNELSAILKFAVANCHPIVVGNSKTSGERRG